MTKPNLMTKQNKDEKNKDETRMMKPEIKTKLKTK